MTKTNAIKAIHLQRGMVTDRGTVTTVEVSHRRVYVRFNGKSALHMLNHDTMLKASA